MINFGALSILLIHRELLSDGKGLINTVYNGVTGILSMWKYIKEILKEKGKIKGGNYRMLENSKRSFVWRQIVSSLTFTNYPKEVFMDNKARALS